ncbi:acylphosphatase [Uliginosibacterium sp. sgz301328]|uniref:acylphosphatase n=1 Tax=Uliginosibacterium sp. sgz301328 TaxID=3243764 RepID=UPI00359E683B
MEQPRISRHLVIRGRVQGVGFRWTMQRQAEALGVDGWVRNKRDGTVESLVCGPQQAVAAMIDWAMHGPAGAKVEEVEVEDSTEIATGFTPAATL